MQSRSRKPPAAQCREFKLIFEIFIATCAGLSHYANRIVICLFSNHDAHCSTIAASWQGQKPRLS